MKAGGKTVKLGEVCSFERGLTYSKSDEADAPGITVLRANNVDLTSGRLNLDDLRYISAKVAVDEKKYLSANSIIVCTASGSRDHLGKTAHIAEPPRMTFGGFMGLLRPSPEIDSLFLFYLTRSDLYRSFISGLSSGTNINNLKGSDLLSWEIPLPPLAEQKRIVALLDEAFAGIDEAKAKAEANMEHAKSLLKSHLATLFSSQGDGWIELSLSELCVVDWGNTALTKTSYVEDGEFLAVSAAGCDGRINHKEHAKHTPVLSAIGAQCGRMFLPEEDFTAIKNTITLTPHTGKCTGKFLYRLLTHVELPKRGAAQPFIAKGDILSFRVAIPDTVDAQSRIEDALSKAETDVLRLLSHTERRLAAFSELKRSILFQAFAGELTA